MNTGPFVLSGGNSSFRKRKVPFDVGARLTRGGRGREPSSESEQRTQTEAEERKARPPRTRITARSAGSSAGLERRLEGSRARSYDGEPPRGTAASKLRRCFSTTMGSSRLAAGIFSATTNRFDESSSAAENRSRSISR